MNILRFSKAFYQITVKSSQIQFKEPKSGIVMWPVITVFSEDIFLFPFWLHLYNNVIDLLEELFA
jgi:hypothetical protein